MRHDFKYAIGSHTQIILHNKYQNIFINYVYLIQIWIWDERASWSNQDNQRWIFNLLVDVITSWCAFSYNEVILRRK